MVSITVGSSKRSDIKYISLSHFIYQDVIDWIVCFPVRRSPWIYEFCHGKHCIFDN